MTDQPPDALDNAFQKAGTAIIGIILIGIGLLMEGRKMAIAGLIIIALGLCFIGYSMTMKKWCVPQVSPSFNAWVHSNFSCIEKGWLSF